MARKFAKWHQKIRVIPQTFFDVQSLIQKNRNFVELKHLDYGDNGLKDATEKVLKAIKKGQRLQLVVDKDTDGLTSGISWIWFLEAIGYENYDYYSTPRKDGYGLTPQVARMAASNGAELVITADLGITARAEVEWLKGRGIDVVITDHHEPQDGEVPDCTILNPKYHENEEYRQLCGAGITFVLLRSLGDHFNISNEVWKDLLALAGAATIADMVILNRVNHRLAKLGIQALSKSKRPAIQAMLKETNNKYYLDEMDLGFAIAPRINAVGRLSDPNMVVEAFTSEDPSSFIKEMTRLNEERKDIQRDIIERARIEALKQKDNNFLLIGGDFHTGVVGIAANHIATEFWRPVLIYNNTGDLHSGSARSILGFSIIDAFVANKELFESAGGHVAAGGASWKKENEEKVRYALNEYAKKDREKNPRTWNSYIAYDFPLPDTLWDLELLYALKKIKPFGIGFPAPLFKVSGQITSIRYMKNKKTGKPGHTAMTIIGKTGNSAEVVFFNEVHRVRVGLTAEFIVSASINRFRGAAKLQFLGSDLQVQIKEK